jgi:hypothetical protein
MTVRKQNNDVRPLEGNSSGGSPATGEDVRNAPKALPPDSGKPDTGLPGGGQGRVDLTGIMPEGIRVDPDITEGHPGYQESGDSEIIPNERLTGGKTIKE